VVVQVIAVGVDGSEESKRALEWAVEEARAHNATVEALYAYEYTPPSTEFGLEESGSPRMRDLHDARLEREATLAREHAEAFVEDFVREIDTTGVTVRPVALHDRRPARMLVERSKDVDLLVVGSRGRGGFAGLVLGSVSQQCAHHASCPVVIIRAQR
jgi:nucleotide-binding universal stress UspA family protein